MKEIHLGKVLLENRHRLGVTQDELAEYLGVSKAAVSKWETETTDEAMALFRKVKTGTDDPSLGTEALQMEALCLIAMAQGWASMGEKNLCLSLLEKYADLATGEIWTLRLKGDDYFNLIDDWFEKNLLLGTQLPRDEAVIRQSMVQSIAENPAFSGFADDTRFLTVIQRLEQLTTEPADPVTKE